MPEPIEYASPDVDHRRWAYRKRWQVIAIVVAICAVLLPDIEVCIDCGWICAVCGSHKQQTEWRGGFTSGGATTPSALDVWIAQNLGGHSHDWRQIQGTGRNLFGRSMSAGHGPAPPILMPPGLLARFVRASRSDDLARFVRIMQTGTDEEQRQAVSRACDIVLGEPPAIQGRQPEEP